MRTQAIRHLKALPVAALLLFGVFVLQPDLAYAQENGGEFVNGEIVVKLAPGVDINAVNQEYGTETKETFLGSARIYLLRVTDTENTEAKVERMETTDLQKRFIYAEPNFNTDAPEGDARVRFRADAAPELSSDPALYKSQYAVSALNMSCANGISRGAGTTVAILDTGVQHNHPVLKDSLVTGYDFIEDTNDTNGPEDEGNQIDDDGDTFTDEGTGHGTHVAGIVHLAAPDAKIMPLRVLDSEGRGNVFVIAEAVQRAVDPDGNPATDDGADVINMSLGSSRESELLADVTDDLSDDDDADTLKGVPAEGVVAVASAGNENVETPVFPAAEPGVLSVASVGQDEKKSEFSNFGATWIDVAAPGDDIYSAFPTDRYASWDGTSMAAPFVAGQAALIRSLEPTRPPTGLTNSVESSIKDTARSLDAANPTYAGKLGAGHADIGASLKSLRPDSTCPASTPPASTPPPVTTTPVTTAPVVSPVPAPIPNTAPTISSVRPAAYSKTRDRTPLIAASVRDAQTNLAKGNVKLFVNGRGTTAFSYNAATDRLTYTPRSNMAIRSHNVKIEATDAQGSKGVKQWSFRIVR